MLLLLPAAGPCARHAAAVLLRALMVGFTTELTQLARQAEGQTPAKIRRQFFARWLSRPHWEPDEIYSHLNRELRRRLLRSDEVLLLVDFTDLSTGWTVLQVSIPWQGRALPVYRSVVHYQAPEVGRRELLRAAWRFLEEHLPGPRSRYTLVMDRGLPGHWLIRELQEAGWRIDLRINGTWKQTHPEYTGRLQAACGEPEAGRPVVRRFLGATLGRRDKGREEWSQANVVIYNEQGYKEPWILVTTEQDASRAVAIYRERMKIECEFRDLKGPFGLDKLAEWEDRERVARFLALVAIYEWRLAFLWVWHQLHREAPRFVKYGKLSWIRITREWIQQRLRDAARRALAFL
jgi:hypothetical protein